MELKSEILNSAKQELSRRMLSPVFGTFTIYWALFHWQFLVTLFFVGSDEIWKSSGLLKTEYIKLTYLNWSDPYLYFAWILPAIMTILTIWKFPGWFLLKADQLDTDYRVQRENIRLEGEKKIIREEIAVEKISTEKLKKEGQRIKKQQEVKDSLSTEEKWKVDYELFMKTDEYYRFGDCLKKIYSNTNYKQNFDPDLLAVLDSFSLLNIESGNIAKVNLTDKGRYFSRLYSARRHNSEIFEK